MYKPGKQQSAAHEQNENRPHELEPFARALASRPLSTRRSTVAWLAVPRVFFDPFGTVFLSVVTLLDIALVLIMFKGDGTIALEYCESADNLMSFVPTEPKQADHLGR